MDREIFQGLCLGCKSCGLKGGIELSELRLAVPPNDLVVLLEAGENLAAMLDLLLKSDDFALGLLLSDADVDIDVAVGLAHLVVLGLPGRLLSLASLADLHPVLIVLLGEDLVSQEEFFEAAQVNLLLSQRLLFTTRGDAVVAVGGGVGVVEAVVSVDVVAVKLDDVDADHCGLL